MARGQWTQHTANPQQELLDFLQNAGGSATMSELYRAGAWGIRTQTIQALIQKGRVTCSGNDVWRDRLSLVTSVDSDPTTTTGDR